jgi:hypothetical protein
MPSPHNNGEMEMGEIQAVDSNEETEQLKVRELSLAAFIWMKTGQRPRIQYEGFKRSVFLFDGDPSIFEEFFKSEIPKHAEFIKMLKRMLRDVEQENRDGKR